MNKEIIDFSQQLKELRLKFEDYDLQERRTHDLIIRELTKFKALVRKSKQKTIICRNNKHFNREMNLDGEYKTIFEDEHK